MNRRDLLLLLLVCLAVAYAVYANTFGNAWTYDDTPVIVQNPDLKSLANFFTNSNPGRPLRELSLMLDRAIFGMEPAGWHLQHIFWHALNGFLAGALALRLGGGMAAAVVTALFFLVHPLQVEVVAQLSHRKDNLALAMALLALHCWLALHANAAMRWRITMGGLALFLFLLGCLAKESVVLLPVMLLVYEQLFVPRERRMIPCSSRQLLALVGVGVMSGGVWYLFFDGRDQILTTAGYQLFKYNYFTPVTEWTYLPILLKSWLFMFVRVLWPFDLAIEYVYTMPQTWMDPWVVAAMVIVIAWGGCIAWYWRRTPVVAFAIAWTGLFWLPVANLWPTAYFAADRYLYAPMVGIALLFGWAAASVPPRWRTAGVLSCTVLLLGFGLLTWRQNAVWKSSLTLWEQAYRVSPQSISALNNYGVRIFQQGRSQEGLALIEQAAQNPYYFEANRNAAMIYERMGMKERAAYYFDRASNPHAGNKFTRY